ncbi:hypothetical protein HY375_00930 [Candidatus Berkelbacteria bacterium]|nr:hypothetical protein [Candidatus Berkelbacteria bacterium]
MTFLKFVSAFGLAALLYFMLGNAMVYLYPPSSVELAYDTCYDRYPYPSQSEFGSTEEYTAAETQATNDRVACEKTESQISGDKQALVFQNALLRSVAVFIVLILLAIGVHRRFPFLSGSLLLGGLLFTLIYPFTAQWGGLMDLSGYGELTDVQKQVQLTKFVIEAIGFLALILGHVLFFEREPEPAAMRPNDHLHHTPPTHLPPPPHLPPTPPGPPAH